MPFRCSERLTFAVSFDARGTSRSGMVRRSGGDTAYRSRFRVVRRLQCVVEGLLCLSSAIASSRHYVASVGGALPLSFANCAGAVLPAALLLEAATSGGIRLSRGLPSLHREVRVWFSPQPRGLVSRET